MAWRCSRFESSTRGGPSVTASLGWAFGRGPSGQAQTPGQPDARHRGEAGPGNGGRQAQQEARGVSLSEEGDRDPTQAGASQCQRQRWEGPPSTHKDGGQRPGDEAQEGPDGEEEEEEGQAGFNGHADRVWAGRLKGNGGPAPSLGLLRTPRSC